LFATSNQQQITDQQQKMAGRDGWQHGDSTPRMLTDSQHKWVTEGPKCQEKAQRLQTENQRFQTEIQRLQTENQRLQADKEAKISLIVEIKKLHAEQDDRNKQERMSLSRAKTIADNKVEEYTKRHIQSAIENGILRNKLELYKEREAERIVTFKSPPASEPAASTSNPAAPTSDRDMN
jgi:hypothetical protein